MSDEAPSPNRVQQLTPANTETDARLAPVNPQPAVGAVLSQTALKAVTAIVVLATGVTLLPAATLASLPAWLPAVASSIVGLGVVFGLVSPGIRRKAE